jgi:hypothetical protein
VWNWTGARKVVSLLLRMRTVFLLDLDQTLLNSDKFICDFRDCLRKELGERNASRYWGLVKRLRHRSGCDDYLSALQRYRDIYPHDARLIEVCRYLLDYPFANRLFADALELLAAIRKISVPVIFSEGETLFQMLKIHRSGVGAVVRSKILIFNRKEEELKSVRACYRAQYYVAMDDEADVLAAIKKRWKHRVFTVFVQHSGKSQADTNPLPDLTIRRLGELLEHDFLSKLATGSGF